MATTMTNEGFDEMREGDIEHENSVGEVNRQCSIHDALEKVQEKEAALWTIGEVAKADHDYSMVVDSISNANPAADSG